VRHTKWMTNYANCVRFLRERILNRLRN